MGWDITPLIQRRNDLEAKNELTAREQLELTSLNEILTASGDINPTEVVAPSGDDISCDNNSPFDQ